MTAHDRAVSASTIHVNGAPRAWAGGSVNDLLVAAGVDPARQGIAIAINAEVVPRSAWASRPVAPGDVVEIVGAVQGG